MSRKLVIYALLYTGCFGRNVREEVDPLLQEIDGIGGVKEKRCPRVRAENPGIAPGIVGSTFQQPQPQQQPLQSTLNQHLCQTCQNRHACRVLKNCEACNKWCDDPQNLQSRSNFEEKTEHPLVSLSEGVLKDSIINLLGVENGDDVDKLTCLVTTRSGKPPGINGDQQRVLNDPQELFEHVKRRIKDSLMGRVKEQEVNCLSTEDIERLLDDILRNVTSPIKQDSMISSSRASFSEPIATKGGIQPIIVPQVLNLPIIEGTLDPSRLNDPQLAMENPNEPVSQITPTQNMQSLVANIGEFKTQGAKLRDFYQRMKEKVPSASFLRGKTQQISESLAQGPIDSPTDVETTGLIEKLETETIPQENSSLERSDGLAAPNVEQQPMTVEQNPMETFEPGNQDDLKTRSHHLLEKVKAKKPKSGPSHHHHLSRSESEELEVTAPSVKIPLGLNQQIVDPSLNQDATPTEQLTHEEAGEMQTRELDLAPPNNVQTAITEETPTEQLTIGEAGSTQAQELDLASPNNVQTAIPEKTPTEQVTIGQAGAVQAQELDLAPTPINTPNNVQSTIPESDDSRTRTYHQRLERLKAKKHRTKSYPYIRSGSDDHLNQGLYQQTSPVDPSIDQEIPGVDQQISTVDQNTEQTPGIDPFHAQEAPEEETQPLINDGENPTEKNVPNLGSSMVDTTGLTEVPETSDLKTKTHHLIQKLKARKQRVETYPYSREGAEDLEVLTPQLDQEVSEGITSAVDPSINQEIVEEIPPMIAEENPTQELITGEESPMGINLGSSIVPENEDANVETPESDKLRTHHLHLHKLKTKKPRRYPSRYPYYRSGDEDVETVNPPLNLDPEEIDQQDLPLNQEVAEETPQQLMVAEENPAQELVTTGDETKTLGSSTGNVDTSFQTESPNGEGSKTRTHHHLNHRLNKKHRTKNYPSRYPYFRSGTEDLESAVSSSNQEAPEEINHTTFEPVEIAEELPQQQLIPGDESNLDASRVSVSTDSNVQPAGESDHLTERPKAKTLKTEKYPSSVVTQTNPIFSSEGEESGEPLTTESSEVSSLKDPEAKEIDKLRTKTHQLLEKLKSKIYKSDDAYSGFGDDGTTEGFLGSEPEDSNVFLRDNEEEIRSHNTGHHRGHHHRGRPFFRSEESDETSESDLETQQSSTDPIMKQEARNTGTQGSDQVLPEQEVRNTGTQGSAQVLLEQKVQNPNTQGPDQVLSRTNDAALVIGDREDRDNFARNHKLLEKLKQKTKKGHGHRSSEVDEEELPKGLNAKTHQLMKNIKEKLEKFNRNSDAGTERPDLGRGDVKQLLSRHGTVEEGEDPKLEEILQQVETIMKNLERTLPPPPPDQKEILGSQPLESSLEVYSVPVHPKTPGPKPYDLVSSPHDDDMYFISNGIKLPLRQVRKEDGAVHLAIDVDRLCSCNNITCQKDETLERAVGSILEKEPELKVILEPESDHLDFSDVPLGSPHMTSRFLGDSGELQHENSGILKRSPTKHNDIPKELLQTTTNTNANSIETTTLDSIASIQKSSNHLKEYLTNKLFDLRSKLQPQPKSDIPMFNRFQKWLQSFDSSQDSNVLLPLTKKDESTFQKWLKNVTPSSKNEQIPDSSEQSNLQLLEKELRDKMEKIDEYNRMNGEIIKKESNAAESAILREEIGIMGNFLKWLKGVVNSNNSRTK